MDPDKVAAPALQLSMSGSNSEPMASDAASLTTTVPSAFCDCGGTTIMARGTTIAEGTRQCNNCGRPVSMDRVRSVVVAIPGPATTRTASQARMAAAAKHECVGNRRDRVCVLRHAGGRDFLIRGRYSHSMVPGGLLVTSSVTRLISRTSLVMRVEILAIKS